MKGDYATLAGVWKNGEGLEIIITADGKTNRNESISPNSISNFKFPTLNIRSGNSGAMIALFKIGFRNPRTKIVTVLGFLNHIFVKNKQII